MKPNPAPHGRVRNIIGHLCAAEEQGPPKTGGAGHADAVVDASKAFHPLQEMNHPGACINCPERWLIRVAGATGVPRLGDATMFDPDYIGGLRQMMEKSDSATWLGYYDNFQEDVLIVRKPEHVTEVLSPLPLQLSHRHLARASLAQL